MRTRKVVKAIYFGFVLLFIGVLFAGCAVPLGHGRMLYTFGEPQVVIVTNNLRDTVDVVKDGAVAITLGMGESYRVPLPWDMLSNTVVTAKVWRVGIPRVYLGQVTRMFYPQSGSNNSQEWVINYYEPVR